MFTLPKLPYAYDALEPVISERTMKLHHDKHHGTYVKTTNELLEQLGAPVQSLEAVIRYAAENYDAKLFNNAAQAWNHAFFWVSMSPDHRQPEGELAAAIVEAFAGDFSNMAPLEFLSAVSLSLRSFFSWCRSICTS